ncbi:MAG TPA: class I SAM-dependent methyltransferase [Myxococcota bacterium]|nr:class I SAM-dependent methyltransferase [Myxococcota bacterium]
MCAAAPELAMDEARARGFALRMREILDGGALALLVSIGHRTGLFDTLAAMAPAHSRAIARESGLDERYVREWLSAMVAGGVVRFDEARGLYRLPAEHAASLTRRAGPENLAVPSQWLALLGGVEDELVDCFASGGGVPASCYRRFRKVMAEDSGQRVTSLLLSDVLPLAPGLAAALEKGCAALDVGCGIGRTLCELAQRFPRSRFVGLDLSVDAIAEAKRGAAERRLENVRFEVRDAAELRGPAQFDFASAFGVIHRQPEPERVLASVAAALRPGGLFLMQEEASTGSPVRDAKRPLAAFSYALSCLQSLATSRAAGGAGLGAMWGAREARGALAAAGFHRIEEKRIARDPRSMYFVARATGRVWNLL